MPKKISDVISEDVKKNFKIKKITPKFSLTGNSKQNKYSKEAFAYYFRGYNFLENLLVVRPYIQKRYKINHSLLELLLMLSAKQFFTQADYAEIPKQYKYRSIKNIIATGYVGIVQNGENLGKHIYTINRKGLEIVIHFYECLSGEKPIPETFQNPFARPKSATNFDKKRLSLIKKLNSLPVPDSKKSLFQ